MRRLTAILFSIIAAAAAMQAQTSMRVDAPNVVAADEQFNVTFILEGEDAPSDFQWSQGDDFQLIWGPQEGRSTSLQIINGKRTRSSQFTYTYILMPKKAGTFTLPRATAKVKGREITSSGISVEVVSGSSSGGRGQASPSGGRQPSDNVTGISDDDIFLRLTLRRIRGCQIPFFQRLLEPGGRGADKYRVQTGKLQQSDIQYRCPAQIRAYPPADRDYKYRPGGTGLPCEHKGLFFRRSKHIRRLFR